MEQRMCLCVCLLAVLMGTTGGISSCPPRIAGCFQSHLPSGSRHDRRQMSRAVLREVRRGMSRPRCLPSLPPIEARCHAWGHTMSRREHTAADAAHYVCPAVARASRRGQHVAVREPFERGSRVGHARGRSSVVAGKGIVGWGFGGAAIIGVAVCRSIRPSAGGCPQCSGLWSIVAAP